MEHTAVNGSVHTACKQHQKVCTQICRHICSRVLCEWGLRRKDATGKKLSPGLRHSGEFSTDLTHKKSKCTSWQLGNTLRVWEARPLWNPMFFEAVGQIVSAAEGWVSSAVFTHQLYLSPTQLGSSRKPEHWQRAGNPSRLCCAFTCTGQVQEPRQLMSFEHSANLWVCQNENLANLDAHDCAVETSPSRYKHFNPFSACEQGSSNLSCKAFLWLSSPAELSSWTKRTTTASNSYKLKQHGLKFIQTAQSDNTKNRHRMQTKDKWFPRTPGWWEQSIKVHEAVRAQLEVGRGFSFSESREAALPPAQLCE